MRQSIELPEKRYATRSRSAISQLLAREQRYLSAAAIHRMLKARKVPVSLATVYRTLDLLVSTGSVSARTEDGGESTFVYCTGRHHHHAICNRCGRVEEIGCAPVTPIAKELMTQYSFELGAHSMEFYGKCARCR
ncbi:MAG: transcriptional repressor [Candidatus Eremiobacteraeota bacterium]|nr:transcriptional repressor [Candidatus Eremiobacteraeota bacterium]